MTNQLSSDPKRFGLVRTFRFVLWFKPGGEDSWRAIRSGDDQDALHADAMAYPSDRVRVLPMGQSPGGQARPGDF